MRIFLCSISNWVGEFKKRIHLEISARCAQYVVIAQWLSAPEWRIEKCSKGQLNCNDNFDSSTDGIYFYSAIFVSEAKKELSIFSDKSPRLKSAYLNRTVSNLDLATIKHF
jgi:hypothetical protein